MTVIDQIDLAQPLSTAMREGSMAEHQEAEGSNYMSELLGGQINEAGYTAYLSRLHPVYVALEEIARENLEDPCVAAVYDVHLERLAAIEADLAHWTAGTWSPGQPLPATSAAADSYAQRVRDSASWGGLLVAHHYTRYLGDLSGGQAIGRILDRAFGLDGQGLAFYAFTEIPKPKPYKDDYRARLDALDLTPEQVDRIVGEVKVAFQMNQAIFAELGAEIDAFRR